MSGIGGTLRELSEAASFTVTDMATWCGAYRQAMREWMTNDVKPHPIREKALVEALALLRGYLKQGGMLPVPMNVSQFDRKAYIEEAKAHALKTLPKRNSAGRRGKMLDEHQG